MRVCIHAGFIQIDLCIAGEPFVIKQKIFQGRLRHGFHFTLKPIVKETAVTFVTEKVEFIQMYGRKSTSNPILWSFKLCQPIRIYILMCITKVAGTLVSPDRPFAAQGDWLQVLEIKIELREALDFS